MAATFSKKGFKPVILIQNVEHFVVFVCKITAFHVQWFLNDKAPGAYRPVHLPFAPIPSSKSTKMAAQNGDLSPQKKFFF